MVFKVLAPGSQEIENNRFRAARWEVYNHHNIYDHLKIFLHLEFLTLGHSLECESSLYQVATNLVGSRQGEETNLVYIFPLLAVSKLFFFKEMVLELMLSKY